MDTLLNDINIYLQNNVGQVNDWLTMQRDRKNILPIFTSVDLRQSNFKVVPVDTNIFPGGFNNVSAEGLEKISKQLRLYLDIYFPNTKTILLFPESFTRNEKYSQNLDALIALIRQTGYETKLFVDKDFEKVDNKLLSKDGWYPEVIILNNDLTDGVPQILKDINQPIIPNINYGWYKRLKSKHFNLYNGLIEDFCTRHQLDKWFFQTNFEVCNGINFKKKIGLDSLAKKIDLVLEATLKKYQEYSITTKPFVFIKADRGTYGRGILVAYSGHEILNINKKTRNSMHILKYGTLNDQVIIQEGVPTQERFNGTVAESLAYLCAGELMEILLRTNSKEDAYSNLNSEGMEFISNYKDEYIYIKKFVAEVATIAASIELINDKKDIL